MNKEISLSEKKYFEIFIGKRVLKEEVFNSTGKIPVYSANVFTPFGFVHKSNIEDFSTNYILWAIDGDFNFNLIPKETKFATTDHCGTIKILDGKINPDYLLYQLRLKAKVLGFDRTLRPSLGNMKKVDIKIPLDKNGGFDTEMQKELADKYKKLLSIIDIINLKEQEIDEISVEIELPDSGKKVSIGKIFDFPETNSGMTKDLCDKNKGNIPVYASSKSPESVLGYISDSINNMKYYHDSLTWNRNGSVGKVFFRKGKFSTNEDHRVLKLKEEYEELIDKDYIKIVLENEIKKMGFGFTNKLGSTKMAEIEISIPYDKKGNISIKKQIELKEKYHSIDSLRQRLSQSLQNIKEVTVDI